MRKIIISIFGVILSISSANTLDFLNNSNFKEASSGGLGVQGDKGERLRNSSPPCPPQNNISNCIDANINTKIYDNYSILAQSKPKTKIQRKNYKATQSTSTQSQKTYADDDYSYEAVQARNAAKRKQMQIDEANREKSGLFLGFDLGGGTPPYPELMYQILSQMNLTSIDFHMGVFLGGKHFFNDYFGLRYYALIHWNISNAHNKFGSTYNFSNFASEFNLDLLLNIYNTDFMNVGLVGGLGLGGGAIIGDIDLEVSKTLANNPYATNAPSAFQTMRFSIGPNLGVRVVFAKKHGLEFNYNLRAMLGNKVINDGLEYQGVEFFSGLGPTMPIHNFFFRYAYTF